VIDKLEQSRDGSIVDGSIVNGATTQISKKHPEEIYEILCNDMLLPWYMTLAAVKQFIWRQAAGELVLQYRRAESSEEAVLGMAV